MADEIENTGASAEARTEARAAQEPKRQSADEIVKHAVKCFITDAVGMEPTDGAKAIAAYFEKNARDDLKARVKAEGKTAKGCWRFIVSVARTAHAQHIDPVAVYAMAMHYFEDVPAMPEWEPGAKADKHNEDGGARAAAPTPTKPAAPTPTPTKTAAPTPTPAKTAKKAKPKKVRVKWVAKDLFGMAEQQLPAGAGGDAQDPAIAPDSNADPAAAVSSENIGASADAPTEGQEGGDDADEA